jgi:hypothetical protein
MLEELVSEIDYDISKTYFVYDEENDEHCNPQPLVDIVKRHLEKAKKSSKKGK